jgi:hypothetical protein
MVGAEQWTTSVRNLILNFRDALAILTPYMDKAKIGWRDQDSYDDWDEIAQSLYKNMVLRSILFSIERKEGIITPEYGMIYPSYEDKSFIEVIGSTSPLDGYQVFVGFSTLEQPFDQITYQQVSGVGLRAIGEPACLRLAEANFMSIVNRESGGRERLSDILLQV